MNLLKQILTQFKNTLGFFKVIYARHLYFDHLKISRKEAKRLGFLTMGGYQNDLSRLRNKHEGQRGFIIANGPSLQDIDMSQLKDEITLGCNGIYSEFDNWGFHTTYFFSEDVVQTELRSRGISTLKGPKKYVGIHNARSFRFINDINYFHLPTRRDMAYYFEEGLYPQFSRDFASIVHGGATITYIMLQFAYHIGLNEVYIIGLDHNYGKLPELFPPGKIEVTQENIHLIRECHYDKNYYKIGDKIGVPKVKEQEMAYELAKNVFESSNRKIYNASTFSKLETFDKIDIQEVIQKK